MSWNALLFNTFVPVASVGTVCLLFLSVVPHHAGLALGLLAWWLASVVLSLQCVEQPLSVPWLIGLPLAAVGGATMLYRKIPSISKVATTKIPLWIYVAVHMVRLDGWSVWKYHWNSNSQNDSSNGTTMPSIVVHHLFWADTLLIGTSSIFLTEWLFRRQVSTASRRIGRIHWISRWTDLLIHDVLSIWNMIGGINLLLAFLLVSLNLIFAKANNDGDKSLQPPGFLLSPPLATILGTHPIPLLVVFEWPIGCWIHGLLAFHGNAMMHRQLVSESGRRQRQQQQLALPL